MGDTGSLSAGAALGTLAVLLKKELLLFIIGGVFVWEALSVIIQLSYFRFTKNLPVRENVFLKWHQFIIIMSFQIGQKQKLL